MTKVVVYFQSHATEEDILLFVRELESHPITGGVAVVKESAQQSVRRLTCFPQCKGCEYNPCDLANNSDYCPARR